MHVRDGGRLKRQRSLRSEVVPLLTLLLLAAIFFLSYFNRFAGVRSGDGEFSGGMALLAGRLPYRDYYTAGPPLNQIKSALELLIFGKALIVTRAAAVIERLCIAALLYVWLRRNFGTLAALLGSLVTVIVSAGDRSDPLASYNHDAIFFAMVCGYAACLSLENVRLRRVFCCAAIAGAGAGLSALTKQTVGLGTAVIIFVIASVACIRRYPRAICVWLTAYCVGFSVPVLAVGVYLRHLGVLAEAVRMLFISGPSAKASHPADFLQRTIFVGWDNAVWAILGLLALCLSGRAVWRILIRSLNTSSALIPNRSILMVLLASVGLFGICETLSRLGVPAVWNFSKSAVYYTIFGMTLFAPVLLLQALRKRNDEARFWDLAIFAAVGWCVAFTLSLSWPAFEAMTLPGLALLIAAAVEGAQSYRGVLYALLAVLLCFQLREKLDLPFTFGAQDEPPVRLATTRSSLPALRGMLLPLSTVELLDEVTRGVQESTSPNETIFTYPEMGLFYTLADRPSPTRAGSHNIDVVPDWFAREEAKRLLDHPPAVLLYARPTETQLAGEEKLWRHGRLSGQRDIIAALDKLTSSYVLTGTYVLDKSDNPILTYVRSDRLRGPLQKPGPK